MNRGVGFCVGKAAAALGCTSAYGYSLALAAAATVLGLLQVAVVAWVSKAALGGEGKGRRKKRAQDFAPLVGGGGMEGLEKVGEETREGVKNGKGGLLPWRPRGEDESCRGEMQEGGGFGGSGVLSGLTKVASETALQQGMESHAKLFSPHALGKQRSMVNNRSSPTLVVDALEMQRKSASFVNSVPTGQLRSNQTVGRYAAQSHPIASSASVRDPAVPLLRVSGEDGSAEGLKKTHISQFHSLSNEIKHSNVPPLCVPSNTQAGETREQSFSVSEIGPSPSEALVSSEWVWDPEFEMYWSSLRQLYYDSELTRFFDPKSQMFFDTKANRWVPPIWKTRGERLSTRHRSTFL